MQRLVHIPQVYAALARLEVLQLVHSDADKTKSVGLRGRTRRYYTITARGLRLLGDGVRFSGGAGPKEPTGYESREDQASTA
jgi:DNA-binding PadR family transcriptional regulator